jgi:hypothetical protein
VWCGRIFSDDTFVMFARGFKLTSRSLRGMKRATWYHPERPRCLDSNEVSLRSLRSIDTMPFNRHDIESLTITGTDATHASVSLQTQQTLLLRTRKEGLLLVCISAVDSEADVHPAAYRLVRDDAVHARVVFKRVVDQPGLLIRDLLLATNALGAVRVYQSGHDLPSYPDVEDW